MDDPYRFVIQTITDLKRKSLEHNIRVKYDRVFVDGKHISNRL